MKSTDQGEREEILRRREKQQKKLVKRKTNELKKNREIEYLAELHVSLPSFIAKVK